MSGERLDKFGEHLHTVELARLELLQRDEHSALPHGLLRHGRIALARPHGLLVRLPQLRQRAHLEAHLKLPLLVAASAKEGEA